MSRCTLALFLALPLGTAACAGLASGEDQQVVTGPEPEAPEDSTPVAPAPAPDVDNSPPPIEPTLPVAQRIARLCAALCPPELCDELGTDCVSECFAGLSTGVPGCSEPYAEVLDCHRRHPIEDAPCDTFQGRRECNSAVEALQACYTDPPPLPSGPPGEPTNPTCDAHDTSGPSQCERRYVCEDAELSARCSVEPDGRWSCACFGRDVFVSFAPAPLSVGAPCAEAAVSCGFSY